MSAARSDPSPRPARASVPGRPAPDTAGAYRPDPRLTLRLVIAGLLAAVVVLPQAVDKHHYAAHRLTGRIFAAVLIWLLVACVILLALAGVAWLTDRVRATGRTRLTGAISCWLASFGVGAAAALFRFVNRHHFAYPQVGPRITATIAVALLFALVIRLLLLALAAVLSPERDPSSPFG
jgi:hypothetical protein